mmetsp:Transcript_42967/g.77082  ORF Transcript_42967/g.77082 Transcript_42967/m.77082 type:complete len:203 (-) Transcript_42967:81-689(-)
MAMADASTGSARKSARGRRLSWADDPMMGGQPLITPIAPAEEADPSSPSSAADKPGELTVVFGIIRIGNLYATSVWLPRSTSAEVITPLPAGLRAEVVLVDAGDGHGAPCLRLEYEVVREGRHQDSFHVRLRDSEMEIVTVRVEATAVALRDARPSSIEHNVELIRTCSAEIAAAVASHDAVEWMHARQLPEEADADDVPPG